MAEPAPIEVHKALADDTRYRLYRYLRLSGRPVSVRELVDPALACTRTPCARTSAASRKRAWSRARSQRGAASVGRPQTVYTPCRPRGARGARLPAAGRHPGRAGDRGTRQRERAEELAREWGAYLVGRSVHRARRPTARGAQPRRAAGGAGRGRIRPAVPAAQREARSRSRCATARSATCSRSTASWCAPSTGACSRACWAPRGRRCELVSFEPLAERSVGLPPRWLAGPDAATTYVSRRRTCVRRLKSTASAVRC